MTAYRVWCLIIDNDNTHAGQLFKVSVDSTKDIDDLRDMIKDKTNHFKDVPTDELELWKVVKEVSHKTRRATLKSEIANLKFPARESEGGSTDDVELLNPPEKLFFYWETAPKEDYVHVIVRAPAGTMIISPSTLSDSNLSATTTVKQALVHPKKELQALYDNSWGKPWPTRERTIDVPQTADPDQMDVDLISANATPDDNNHPTQPTSSTCEYICLDNIQFLVDACQIPFELPNVIVVRDEYITPTAFQFAADHYILFDESGVKVHDALSTLPTLQELCWALADSNDDAIKPSRGFRAATASLRARIIQTTSARPDRWKDWSKYLGKCATMIVDLPKPIEIAAIAQEMGYNPSTAIALIHRWGPCTRTVIRILDDPSTDDEQAQNVVEAAACFCSGDSVINAGGLQKADSQSSALLFIYPIRNPGPSSRFGRYIPTSELISIYGRCGEVRANQAALNLFEMLGMHPLTRAAYGWRHEKRMHFIMTRCLHPLEIICWNGETTIMQPTSQLLPLTQGALKRERTDNRAFYWFPPNQNFDGIDGVLADSANIFVLQATIADNHRSPAIGLRKVWGLLCAAPRQDHNWHFVVVVDTSELAMDYAKFFGKELADFRLGNPRVPIKVWGCTLPKDA